MTLDSKMLLRDTLLVLSVLVVVSMAVGGLPSVLGTLAGGLIALGNVIIISRSVSALVSEDTRVAGLIGLLVKSIAGMALLLVMLLYLDALGVLLGVGAAVLAMTVRSVAGLFMAPQES